MNTILDIVTVSFFWLAVLGCSIVVFIFLLALVFELILGPGERRRAKRDREGRNASI